MAQSPKTHTSLLWDAALCIACICVGFFMISSRGLWGDEGWTAVNTIPPTFSTWLHTFWTDRNLDTLKPLSGFMTWLLAHVLGTSEYQLRLQNVLWLGLGVVSLTAVGRRWNLWYLPLLFVVHPFVWYYIDEIRPYAMQLGAGALMLYGLLGILDAGFRDKKATACFIGASFIISGSSLLGAFPVAAACILIMVQFIREKWTLDRYTICCILIFVALQIPWGAFYLYWVLYGRDAARLWPTTIGNFVFALYEFCGFAGLGPDRDYLRQEVKVSGMDAGLKAMLATLPLMLPLAILWVIWAIPGVKALFQGDGDGKARWLFSIGAFVLLSFLILGVASILARWPFWGRHLAPVMAAWIFVIAVGLRQLGRFTIIGLVLFCALFLVSSLRLRYSDFYTKEDYRAPSILALEAYEQGQRVGWHAAIQPARYYGLQVVDTVVSEPAHQESTSNRGAEVSERLDIAIMNIRGNIDTGGTTRAAIEAAGLVETDRSLPGFIVFERSPQPAPAQ